MKNEKEGRLLYGLEYVSITPPARTAKIKRIMAAAKLKVPVLSI